MAGTSQYFEPEPAIASQPRSLELVLPDGTLHLQSDRGVFAAAAVDPGTKLLLLESAHPPVGAVDLLDLGCGYGPIALTLARRAPEATVWAIDVNQRALRLCAANAEANGLSNVRAVAPDAVPAGVRFAAIWSNPPIRIGKQALHEMLLSWFDRLDDDANAWLVVQKHLGSDSLARWLEEAGWTANRRVSRAGYRVFEVSRR
ncbi:MAG: rRNA (guanine1207-N2)-methyltransferase [Acidimicrobiaceae bacterium]